MTPGDIHDIRGPISIPYWWIPLAIGVAAALSIALAYGVYRLARRYRRVREKTAAEIALERIERARAMLATSTSSEFSSEVSDAVRAYIEARFSLRAAHRTTEEFLHDLLDLAASPIVVHRDALSDFLSWCDLAKFARLALSAGHATAIVDAARRFVETTATESAQAPRRAVVAAAPSTTQEIRA